MSVKSLGLWVLEGRSTGCDMHVITRIDAQDDLEQESDESDESDE